MDTRISLAAGQTLRVNFFNAGHSPSEIKPCYFYGDGTHLKTGKEFTLAPGQTRSFDLRRAEAGRRTEPSVYVRAGVYADESDLKHLVVSGEIIEDATDRSRVFVPRAVIPPKLSSIKEEDPSELMNPGEVMHSLAPVGITEGQTLRVNFFNMGYRPFTIVPCVFDGDGAFLKTGVSLSLAARKMLSFDMGRAEAGPCVKSRLLVRGAAYVSNADTKNLLITGEVIEDATGKSSFHLLPGVRVSADQQPNFTHTERSGVQTIAPSVGQVSREDATLTLMMRVN